MLSHRSALSHTPLLGSAGRLLYLAAALALLSQLLQPLGTPAAAELAAADPRQLWSGGVGAGLAQLQHAELYSRLFRS